jgi:hypothetical protein
VRGARAALLAALLAVGAAGCGQHHDARDKRLVYADAQGRGGSCSDARDAGQAASPDTPVCTLARALKLVSRGGTVVVRAGRYPAVTLDAQWRSPGVSVRAADAERPSVAGVALARGAGGLRLQGLVVPGGIVLAEDTHDVTISGCDITSAGDAITLLPGTHDVRIEASRIRSPHGDGIVFSGQSRRPGAPNPGAPATAPISRIAIRGNRLYEIGVDAIRPANFRDVVVESNEISGLEETGDHSDVLQSVMGGDGLVFRRNYVHDNTGQGFFIKDGLVRDATVEGNVFVRNRLRGKSVAGFSSAGYQIAVYETQGLRLLDNTVWDDDLGVSVGGDVTKAIVRGNVFSDMVIDTSTSPAGRSAPDVAQRGNVIAGGWNWGARGLGDRRGPVRFRDVPAGDYRAAGDLPAGADLRLAGRRKR